MARTWRHTVKKNVNKWNTINISYEKFIAESDAELYALFCIVDPTVESNPRMDAHEAILPCVCQQIYKNGMICQKQ